MGKLIKYIPAHSCTNVIAEENNFTEASYPLYSINALFPTNYKKPTTMVADAGKGYGDGVKHLLNLSGRLGMGRGYRRRRRRRRRRAPRTKSITLPSHTGYSVRHVATSKPGSSDKDRPGCRTTRLPGSRLGMLTHV